MILKKGTFLYFLRHAPCRTLFFYLATLVHYAIYGHLLAVKLISHHQHRLYSPRWALASS
jgi:hypothetical protein